jgi:hypothetical protein
MSRRLDMRVYAVGHDDRPRNDQIPERQSRPVVFKTSHAWLGVGNPHTVIQSGVIAPDVQQVEVARTRQPGGADSPSLQAATAGVSSGGGGNPAPIGYSSSGISMAGSLPISTSSVALASVPITTLPVSDAAAVNNPVATTGAVQSPPSPVPTANCSSGCGCGCGS